MFVASRSVRESKIYCFDTTWPCPREAKPFPTDSLLLK